MMIVNAYIVNLALLVVLITAGIYSRSRQKPQAVAGPSEPAELEATAEIKEAGHGGDSASDVRFRALRNRFLRVYVLAVAADWLQGSFIYSLYKNTHNLPEPSIAALFATGFVCGAASATFAGALADRYGRKLACMLYCVIYSLSCLSVLSGDFTVLFIGRALGGVSTTLLFTVFDAWLVAEVNRQGFESEGRLSLILGEMSTANGFVAISCGVISQVLVQIFGSEKTPFMASVVCLMLALLLISRYWTENYGASGDTSGQSTKSAAIAAISDPRLLAVAFTACFFEGSMYIMVFYWSEAIISARALANDTSDIPFGLIFANFMSAMTLGSLCFAHVTRDRNSIQRSSHAVQLATSVAASALLVVVLAQGELARFWALCVFEYCLGVYFPSMGFLKGNVIGDEHRGKIYGLIRLPLNVFVVASLGSVKEGDAFRDQTFMICSTFILAATFLVAKYVRG